MMFEYVRKDLPRFKKVYDSDATRQRPPASPLRRLIEEMRTYWDNPGLKALISYRLGRWLQGALRFPLWWPLIAVLAPCFWLLTTYYRLAYDIRLELSADIGPGFYIGHFGGIRIRNCRVGENCAIQHEVVIGSAQNGAKQPTIGNRVWIGAHSKIDGQFTIGNRATIAAGTKIIGDVGEGCLMLGNPARVCRRNYDNSTFL